MKTFESNLSKDLQTKDLIAVSGPEEGLAAYSARVLLGPPKM